MGGGGDGGARWGVGQGEVGGARWEGELGGEVGGGI